jgi:hypothetical protein
MIAAGRRLSATMVFWLLRGLASWSSVGIMPSPHGEMRPIRWLSPD